MISIKTDANGKVTTKYNGPAPGSRGWIELADDKWPNVDYVADYFYNEDTGEITAEKVETDTTT